MYTGNASEPGGGKRGWQRPLQRRLIRPLAGLLSGGLDARPLAMAVAVGALLGSMPLAWGTSLLCLAAALLLRLNPLAVQIGNYAAWPLQLALAYPYLWLGRAWFAPGPNPAPADWLEGLLAANGAALCAWALTTPLLMPLYYAAGRGLVAAAGRRRR